MCIKNKVVETGWRCPRCDRINAPWVRQCDCSPSAYTISCDKITLNPNDSWWQINQNTGINQNSTVYTTSTNQAVGGSDYKDSATGNWTNEPKTYTNTVVNDGTHNYYKLKTPKETK